MKSLSKVGLTLSGAYLLVSAALLFSQGIFGESFIALILGMPWVLALAAIEFGGADGALMYVLIFAPILLNAAILYWIGSFFGKKR